LCQLSFPPCNSSASGPVPLCRSSCQTFRNVCPSWSYAYAGLDCSVYANTSCNSHWHTYAPHDACARPVYIYDTELKECNLKCPLAVYDHSEYLSFALLDIISAWIGLVGTLYVFISYLAIPEYRGKLALWFALSNLFACGGLMSLTFDYSHVVCPGKTGTDVTHWKPCIVMGTLMNIGVIVPVLIWSCIACDLAVRLWLHPSQTLLRYMYYGYLFYSWGVGIISTIILLAKWNTSSYAIVCALAGTKVKLNNILQTAPLTFACFVGILMFGAVVVALVRLSLKTGKITDAMKANLKIILFILCFTPLPLLVVIVQIWQQKGHPVRTTIWIDAIITWSGCLALGMSRSCFLPERFPYGLYLSLVIAIDIQIFCPFLFFGLRMRILKFWQRFFRLLIQGRMGELSSTFTLRDTVDAESKELSKRTQSVKSDS